MPNQEPPFLTSTKCAIRKFTGTIVEFKGFRTGLGVGRHSMEPKTSSHRTS